MARKNGTGPMGQGAMNGRGFGYGLVRESIQLKDKEILKEEKELLQKRLDTLNKKLEDIVLFEE